MRNYDIKLRVDFMDDEKYDIMLEVVREKCREMLTTAIMIKDKREPQIMFSTGDMFETEKDLTIMTPEDLEVAGGE